MMNRPVSFPLASISAALLLSAPLAQAGLLAPGETLHKLSGAFEFTEGPAADHDGNIYFTDQPNDRIVRWDGRTGGFSDWMKPAGRANGMHFDKQGNLLACADERNELWSITPDHKVTVLVTNFGGKLLNGPNDVWPRPAGGLYFTDPLYPRPYWKRDPKRQPDGEHVYFLAADHKTLTPVATDLKQPNGIVGTPDGKILYVADIGAGKTYAYDIQKDGALAGKRLFCNLGSDGMALDNQGNVYLTGRGVTVFDQTGKQIEHFDVAEPWTANVTFGGPNHDFLFVTASKAVYGAKMVVKGAK